MVLPKQIGRFETRISQMGGFPEFGKAVRTQGRILEKQETNLRLHKFAEVILVEPDYGLSLAVIGSGFIQR